MAVRSSSSLHVRQASDLSLRPPSKRPRLQQQQQQQQQHFNSPSSPVSSRHLRRGSSPDLLDTTIEPAVSPKPITVRAATNSPLPTAAVPPLRASRRPRLVSSATTTATTSSYNHAPPSPPPSSNKPRTPHIKRRNEAAYATPALLRESPDPLDTISPAPAVSSRPRPSATRYPRQQQQQQQQQQNKAENTRTNNRTSSQTSTKNARRSSLPSASQASDPAVQANPTQERRSLRSHDTGTKPRSELASYFPNYEKLISLETQERELLTGDTTIQLVDDLPKPAETYLPPDPELPFGNPLVQLHNCEAIQLPNPRPSNDDDPLNEGAYFRAHRRVERQEKQLRNIERERAQHEKLQVDRLLDELRGQDWLRVMGIAAGPDNAKKLYEPKRDYFIRELTALIDKFKVWKEEEKRRKLAKDMKPSSPDVDDNKDEEKEEDDPGADAQSTGETTDDVDVQASRQLLREARSATTSKKPKPKRTSTDKHRKPKPAGQEIQPQSQPKPQHPPFEPPPIVENKPFFSFYPDPEVRAMALGKTDQATLHKLAFGYPIPDMHEQDFELPSDILTDDAIMASQRKQRRMRREGRKSGQ